MDHSIVYKINVWIAEILQNIAPDLYKYRDNFGKSGEATVEMFWKAGLIIFLIGLLLGVLLVVTKKDGIRPNVILYQITNIFVVDDDMRYLGVIHIHDIIKEGIF